jgi:hypothetical protein
MERKDVEGDTLGKIDTGVVRAPMEDEKHSPDDVIAQEKTESSEDEGREPKEVEKPLSVAKPMPKMTKRQMYKAYRAQKKKAAEENPEKQQSAMKNFFRILTFGTKLDYFLMGLCVITAIGSG